MRIRKDLPLPLPADKRYYEDLQWMHENAAALVEAYPDEWVAVVDKQVVAHGKTIGATLKKAHKKGIRSNFVLDFIEGELYIYANQFDIQHVTVQVGLKNTSTQSNRLRYSINLVSKPVKNSLVIMVMMVMSLP